MSRITGKIKTWNEHKGFGFISCEGRDDVFVHITDIPNKQTPQIGDEVSFEIGPGRNGKSKAVNVQFEGQVAGSQPQSIGMARYGAWTLVLLPLLFSLLVASETLLPLILTVVMSAVAFVAMGVDKHLAQNGAARIPETLLHLFELSGGWPGSYVGQRHYAHKTRKHSYQLVFVIIVLIHALYWIDVLVLGNVIFPMI